MYTESHLKHTHDSVVKLLFFYPFEGPLGSIFDSKYIDKLCRSLAMTYQTNFQIVDAPEEAFLPPMSIVSLEENRGTPLEEFEHPSKATYCFGNSNFPYPSEWCEPDHVVSIPVPNPEIPLYGMTAAAIVLHDRFIKQQRATK